MRSDKEANLVALRLETGLCAAARIEAVGPLRHDAHGAVLLGDTEEGWDAADMLLAEMDAGGWVLANEVGKQAPPFAQRLLAEIPPVQCDEVGCEQHQALRSRADRAPKSVTPRPSCTHISPSMIAERQRSARALATTGPDRSVQS